MTISSTTLSSFSLDTFLFTAIIGLFGETGWLQPKMEAAVIITQFVHQRGLYMYKSSELQLSRGRRRPGTCATVARRTPAGTVPRVRAPPQRADAMRCTRLAAALFLAVLMGAAAPLHAAPPPAAPASVPVRRLVRPHARALPR